MTTPTKAWRLYSDVKERAGKSRLNAAIQTVRRDRGGESKREESQPRETAKAPKCLSSAGSGQGRKQKPSPLEGEVQGEDGPRVLGEAMDRVRLVLGLMSNWTHFGFYSNTGGHDIFSDCPGSNHTVF